jgi:hypothetical protein
LGDEKFARGVRYLDQKEVTIPKACCMFVKVESIQTFVVDGANEWEHYQATSTVPADYKRNTRDHMSHRLIRDLLKNLTKDLRQLFRLLLYGGYNIDSSG